MFEVLLDKSPSPTCPNHRAGICRSNKHNARSSNANPKRVEGQYAAQAERERIVAEDYFWQIRTSGDDYFTTVSQSKLLDFPEMAPLHQQLLEMAVRFYRQSAEEHANEPDFAAELAAA